MGTNKGEDQPPAYTRQDSQASITGSSAIPSAIPILKPSHSTRASELFHSTSNGTYTTSQYLELTFSVRVRYGSISEPVVLAIDEDYETLFDDIHTILFGSGKRSMTGMRAFWGTPGGKEGVWAYDWDAVMNTGNMTAMLRLLKSRNGIDYIKVF